MCNNFKDPVFLNDKINWGPLVEIVRKSQKSLNLMSAVSGTWWTADPVILSAMYKGTLRTDLEYGGHIVLPR